MASNKAASPNRANERDARLPLVAAPRLVPAAGYRALAAFRSGWSLG